MANSDEKAGPRRLLTFYTVFATKNLRELIDDEIFERLKEIFGEVKGDSPINVTEWIGAPYYVAVTTKVDIMSGLPAVLRKFKKVSNTQIVKDFPRLEEQLHGDSFWMAAFCCVPAGPKARKLMEDYIGSARRSSESQGYTSTGG